MRNLVTISPLKSKLSGKFQLFNAIDGSIEVPTFLIKINILKHFMKPKQ